MVILTLAPSLVRLRRSRARKDAGQSVHAGGDIGNGNADPGRLVRRTGDADQAGFSLDQQVVGLLLHERAAFAVAGNIADHELRVGWLQCLMRQAKAGSGAGGEVLHQHVGASDQACPARPGRQGA